MRSRLVRYLLTLILPSGLLVLLFLSSLYREEQALLRQHLEAAEEIRLIAGARSLASDVELIASDVRLMVTLPSLAVLLEEGTESARAAFAADLIALSQSRRVYDKLRWIDERGWERVRVDYIENRPFVVPEAQLQGKAQRYFFTGAMQLAPGEIFVSPLDLNVEHGRVEIPIVPTIRIAMAVRDSAGRARGIVIANYFASNLLDKFAEVTEARESGAGVHLLNRDGHWLKAPQAADEWGFMFGRTDHFGTRFPAAWERIAASERGQFKDDHGLWSFTTVRPLVAGMASATGSPLTGPSTVTALRDKYVWKVVSNIPAETLKQGENRNLVWWGLITLLFMGVLSFGAFVLARAQRRRDMMAENLRALNRRLEEKVRQRTQELQKQAIRDPLTGLFNRRYLDETLPREIHRAMREEEVLAVVMVDLDHFKDFNDQWGHEAGDSVLLGVAEALLDGLRASDIACRYGGEEILIVMPGADAEEAVARISAISAQVGNMSVTIMGRSLPPVTFSAGVATLPEHGNNAKMLLRAADHALYMAKESGRNRVVIAHVPQIHGA